MADSGTERRLAAIVAIDVAGYSRLMGADEEGTLATLKAHREVVDPIGLAYSGRLVGTAGDGLLLEFPSVVEAVNYAIEVQAVMADRNVDIEDSKKMLFRIGINLGDILVDADSDIFGDGVNVAARIEALAEPGGICLSRAARDQVRDKLDIAFDDMGEIEVKNIARPVRVFRILAEGEATLAAPKPARPKWLMPAIAAAVLLLAIIGGGTWWWSQQPDFEPADPKKFAFKLPDKPSLAVLPYESLSNDPEHVLFADAISDDLTNNLARISGLFVIASQATAPYRKKQKQMRLVAEELGVRHVVLGSVRRVDDRVRVNVQLVDALSGHQLWAGRFDRQFTDIFALQDEITGAISTELADHLTWSGGNRQTDNIDAHLIWLSAQDDTLASSPQRLAHAKALALRALQLDPNYSRAHALLGFALSQSGYFGYVENRKEAIAKGLKLARRAVALAETDWYSQFVYAHALMNTRDYKAAVKAHDRAITLEPSNAFLLTISALPLNFLGRPDKAISRLETAMRLNPYYTWMPPEFLGHAFYLKGQYEKSIQQLEKSTKINPKFIGNFWWRAAAYAQIGQSEKARAMVKRILMKKPKAVFLVASSK